MLQEIELLKEINRANEAYLWKTTHPADSIKTMNHENLMLILDALAERIAALPESAEECHPGSTNSHAYSAVLRMQKAAAAQAVKTIREVLEGYLEDKE